MISRITVNFIMILACLALFGISSNARADDFDQAVKLTFNQPIQIPNKVLPAGTYWFLFPDHGEGTTENVIQVFDGNRQKVITTLSVINHKADKPSGHVMLTFIDRSPKPEALLTLTYPGRQEGDMFEVSYPKQEQATFSEFPKVNMVVGDNGIIRTSENTKH